MATNNSEDENDQFEDLFGKPSLLEGEDHNRYQRLRAAVVADLKPKTTFDWINAYDSLNKLWEEQRYRQAGVALINGALLKAVIYFLDDICEQPFSEEFALDYFSDNPKKKKEVVAQLAKYGITLAELQAKAAQMEGGGLQMFDRLVAARETGRRQLRKESLHGGRSDNPDTSQ